MLKNSLKLIIAFSIALSSFQSFSMKIPACDTTECRDYFKLYKKYSKAGYAEAMATLGDLYFNGHGTDESINRALKQYKKGAKYGSVNAQYKTAMIYLTNKDHKDIAKGVKYLEKAARSKSKEAAFLLGVIYYKKDFYQRDFEKSDKWLTKAYQTSSHDSATFIRLIDEEQELNANNYPDLLAALAKTPLPPEKEEPQTLTASVQSKPQEQHSQDHQPQDRPKLAHPKIVHPKDSGMEIITVTTTLHEMFAAQISGLKNTYPQKGNVGTGSKIIGRTCEKMVSCGKADKEEFVLLIRNLMGMQAVDAFY